MMQVGLWVGGWVAGGGVCRWFWCDRFLFGRAIQVIWCVGVWGVGVMGSGWLGGKGQGEVRAYTMPLTRKLLLTPTAVFCLHCPPPPTKQPPLPQ